MKRPLCFLSLMFIALLTIGTRLVPLSVADAFCPDGQWITLEGRVYQKEYKKQQSEYGSKETLVIYIDTIHIITNQNHSDTDISKTQESNANISQKEIPLKNEIVLKKERRAHQVQGAICYMDGEAEPQIGNTVRIRGKVRAFSQAGNPGEFDMRRYYRIMKLDFRLQEAEILAIGGKTDRLRERLFQVRQYFCAVLEKVYDEKEASVMKAMLLGEKSGLDKETKELYQRSAILHILSISGLHISMIGMGIYRLLKRIGLPAKICGAAAMLFIIAYGIMTGMSLSAKRAIFMFLLHLLADMAGRSYDMLTALSLAAALLLIEQPRYVEHSGFLFSFGAVAGIGILQPALCQKGKDRGKIRQRLVQSFSVSVAVLLATLPVQLHFYYEFPFYSVFLNMIVIPLMTAVMGSGILAMLIGGVAVYPAVVLASADRVILWFYEKCCMLGERIPGGIYKGGMPKGWQAAGYLLLLLLFACIGKRWKAIWKGLWIGGAVVVLLFRTSDGLEITALDVGQGDCIHIESPQGGHYLIDGGSTSKSEMAKYQLLPYLKAKGVRRLEAVFVTHSDADHCNAVIALLEEKEKSRPQIGALILPDIAAENRDETYVDLVETASKQKILVQYMNRGEYIADGELKIKCMHPEAAYRTENANEYSLVLYLTYGKFCALFTGDIEGIGEQQMSEYMKEDFAGEINSGGSGEGEKRLTLLKVAHHGSGNSTGKEMLKTFPPEISVISCGENNRYGHPHKELIERLTETGSKIYITSKKGAVSVWTDGKRCRVSTFHR